jgi:flagellar hook-associated protein 2
MATLTASGLSTGIDYETLIQQLIEVERASVHRLETKKTTCEQKNAAYSDLAAKLESLESAASALRRSSDFGGKTTTVSDTDILTGSASSSGSTGTYSVVVSELALAHRLQAGVGLASESETIASGAGRFTFKIGEAGTEYSIDVDATMTLEEFKDAINSLDAGLNASVIDDGSGTNPYQLVLSAAETGADNIIIIGQDDTNLGFPVNDTTLSSTLHLRTPQDAEISVDGLTVYRASNTITDVIPGVTLNLHKADSSTTVTFQVGEDREGVQAKIQELIDAYNAVVGFIDARDNYDMEEHKGDPLWAEGTARSVARNLSGIVSSGVDGLPADLKVLSQIGVSTNRDGTLSLDTGKLQDALDEDLEGVTDLFVRDGASANGIAEQLYQFAFRVTRSGDGDIAIRQKGLQDRVQKIDREIEDQEAALDRMEVRLRAQFAALESLIASLQAQDQFFYTNT